MLVKIKLLGELGRKFGREYYMDIRKPAEAIQAIASQVDGFAQWLYTSGDRGVDYRVVTSRPEGLSEDELQMVDESMECLIIAPILRVKGAFGRILLGVVLIGVAFLVPGGFLGLSATTIGLIGGALVLGGLAMLLSPTPETPESEEERKKSHLFDNAAETGRQGRPVSLTYGFRIIKNPTLISAGMTINQVPVN